MGSLISRTRGAAVGFVVGSATAIPVPDQTFDGVTMLHVGMNVEDKAALAREFARVLRPGGTVVVYDVMRVGEGEPSYPLPRAPSAATSFLASPHHYCAALEDAGLAIVGEPENCVASVLAVLAAAAEGPPPPVNLGDLMGQDFPTMIGNLRAMLGAGVLAPVRIVAAA